MTTDPIVQTCFSRSWGGLEIQALEVTEQLHRRGHDVVLACPPRSRISDEARVRKLALLELDVSGYVHPSAVWKLSRFFRARGPRIIHCQLSKDLATIVPAADVSGRTPAILLSKRVGSYILKKDLLHRYTYSRVRRVLAISEAIRANVLATTPMPAAHVVTLHDAIDTEEFSPEACDGASVRKEFGYTDNDTVVGFVGRFSPGKGHEELLHTAAALVPLRPHVRFLIVGEASAGEEAYAEEIRRMAESLQLGMAVTFAGFRRDVPAVMAAFDIFAFPSHAESFGVALIEAMAMERPVVSTNCDGVLDIVVEGETGLYVPPRNAPELARALLRLIDDKRLRGALGRAARRRVLAMFDRRNQIDQLEKIYEEVLHE